MAVASLKSGVGGPMGNVGSIKVGRIKAKVPRVGRIDARGVSTGG